MHVREHTPSALSHEEGQALDQRQWGLMSQRAGLKDRSVVKAPGQRTCVPTVDRDACLDG